MAVGTSVLAERELIYHSPKTPMEARFSMEFPIAAALARGSVGLDTFRTEVLADPLIARLMANVTMSLDSELAKLGFIGTAPVKLRISMMDGTVIEGERHLAVGNPERPMSDDDRKQKFIMCARRIMDKDQAQTWLAAMMDLPHWTCVATSLRGLSQPARERCHAKAGVPARAAPSPSAGRADAIPMQLGH